MAYPVLADNLQRHSSGAPARLALVNMPFSTINAPSIQCGLLKAVLAAAGHIATVHYLNLELASEIGPDHYTSISEGRYAGLLGEWLFSSAAFGYRSDEKDYLAILPDRNTLGAHFDFDFLCKLRNEVIPALVERWAEQLNLASFHAVGFSSVHVQNNACFALAQAVKRRWPHIATVFGGANFDEGMGREFLRKLSFIDYVVNGEGEYAIVELANRLASGEPGHGIQGVSLRTKDGTVDGGRAPKVRDLNVLPKPDYEEYFHTLWRLGKKKVLGSSSPALLMETARGCWWGEKHHCTFCGLNASDMAFRSKSPDRVLQELRDLTAHYQTLNVSVIDNIMNMNYVKKVCEPLAGDRCDYKIFWEVKANLTPRQLKTIADAGIVHVQPGIESLSSHVLELMRKGINMLKNVRFLKWAGYLGLQADWNLLTGFPGETQEDYARQRRLIPLLKHLPAPNGWGRIWLERYSPYFFDPSFPVQDVTPVPAYRFIYPEAIDLKEVAYFFDYKMPGTIDVEEHKELFAALKEWQEAWERTTRPFLKYRQGPGWVEILDGRNERPRTHWLYGTEALVYQACSETDRPLKAICEFVNRETGSESEEDVRSALARCCDLGIMIEEDEHYLSLAQPLNRNWFLDSVPAEAVAAGLAGVPQKAGKIAPEVAA